MATRWTLARLHDSDATGEEFLRMGAWLNRMGRVLDVDESITANPPEAATGGFLWIPGRKSGTTDGAGDLAITFPTAFPNGLVMVLANYPTGTESATGFTAVTGAATTPVVISYVAAGW